MNLQQTIEAMGFAEILRMYGFHADVINKRFSADVRLSVIEEAIAGNQRLKDLDGFRRKAMGFINFAIMEDLLVAMDDAQDKFDDAIIPHDWDQFLIALLLYYAAMTGIARAGSGLGHDAELVKQFRRMLDVDYSFITKWKAEKDEYTDAAWVNRGKLYGGNARGVVFDAIEENGGYGPGWVVDYIAMGDKNTCKPCDAAQGVYLPTQGPFPGKVCKGRSRCRCRRVLRYAPEEYKALAKTPLKVTTETRW